MLGIRKHRRRGVLALLALLAMAGGAFALRLQATVPGGLLSLATPRGGSENARYVADPGQGPNGETGELLSIESYWNTRVTYPTGRFDGAWLLGAASQDRQLRSAVPSGRVTYSRDANPSPLTLDPTHWTSLGPQPLQSNGCSGCFSYGHVSGRVNKVVIDPVTPSVAYLAAVGGGVWKTTNCCASTTTWTATTDDPLITAVQIDDLYIDPSNHNTVYAGT